MVVGVGAFLDRLRGLKLIPSKWRYLVPPTAANANCGLQQHVLHVQTIRKC
jgi:hypothetical protein